MSLIVAKKFDENIFLVSDTLLTEISDESQNFSWNNQILKIVIIEPQIVLAFAGGVVYAENAVREISSLSSHDEIRRVLLKLHCDSFHGTGYGVEFILAIGGNAHELWEFKRGFMLSKSVVWIGDEAAWNLFNDVNFKDDHPPRPVLSETHAIPGAKVLMNFTATLMPSDDNQKTECSQSYTDALQAMKRVINSDTIPAVGGFYVAVAYRQNSFEYMHYSEVFASEQFIPLQQGSTVLGFGTPQKGAYAVSCVEQLTSDKDRIVVFHFLHGLTAVVFQRESSALPKPVVHSAGDPIEVAFTLKNKYSLETLPVDPLGSSLDHFGVHINSLMTVNEECALIRLDFAIDRFRSKSERWKLLMIKMVYLFKRKDYARALGVIQNLSTCIPPSDQREVILLHEAACYIEMGGFEIALQIYDKILRLNNLCGTAYYNRSLCRYRIAVRRNSKDGLLQAIADSESAVKCGFSQPIAAELEKAIKQMISN